VAGAAKRFVARQQSRLPGEEDGEAWELVTVVVTTVVKAAMSRGVVIYASPHAHQVLRA
jgi:hypothetical protein